MFKLIGKIKNYKLLVLPDIFSSFPKLSLSSERALVVSFTSLSPSVSKISIYQLFWTLEDFLVQFGMIYIIWVIL